MTPEALIGTNVKIALKDNRVLDGVITVVDPFGNILLSNVWESSNDKIDPETLHTRELGLVSVPRNTIDEVFMDKRSYEQCNIWEKKMENEMAKWKWRNKELTRYITFTSFKCVDANEQVPWLSWVPCLVISSPSSQFSLPLTRSNSFPHSTPKARAKLRSPQIHCPCKEPTKTMGFPGPITWNQVPKRSFSLHTIRCLVLFSQLLWEKSLVTSWCCCCLA